MEKLKVLFLSAANCIHTIRWVNSLSKELEVHLVYCKEHKPNLDNVNEKVIMHELPFKAPLGYYLNALKLNKIYNEIKPNIVNVHYASGYGTLARISRIKPILLSVWGSDVYDFPNEAKIKKKVLQKNVMYANAIASTSNNMAKELKRQVPMMQNEIYITPFGVDIEKFSKQESKNDDGNFKIGIVKTLKEKYGINYAILAVKALKDKLIQNDEKQLADSIKFYIYGEGEEKQNLQKLINDNGLLDCIFFMGKIPNDEVPKVLNNFDVFCATSNRESFGVAVVEAMACQIPVVATKTDGFCEVMEDEVTGYLVDKKNVKMIAECLEKILRDKELANEMGRNGRKRVIEKYNWEENVKEMIFIYKKLINSWEENKK